MNGEWENGKWGTWDGKSRMEKTENLLKRGVNFILRFKNRPNV